MKHYRRPKGYRNAKRNDIKSTKIPPTNWDDIPIAILKRYYNYAAYLKTDDYSVFHDKMKAKFPRITNHTIRELFNLEMWWQQRSKENWGKAFSNHINARLQKKKH